MTNPNLLVEQYIEKLHQDWTLLHGYAHSMLTQKHKIALWRLADLAQAEARDIYDRSRLPAPEWVKHD